MWIRNPLFFILSGWTWLKLHWSNSNVELITFTTLRWLWGIWTRVNNLDCDSQWTDWHGIDTLYTSQQHEMRTAARKGFLSQSCVFRKCFTLSFSNLHIQTKNNFLVLDQYWNHSAGCVISWIYHLFWWWNAPFSVLYEANRLMNITNNKLT